MGCMHFGGGARKGEGNGNAALCRRRASNPGPIACGVSAPVGCMTHPAVLPPGVLPAQSECQDQVQADGPRGLPRAAGGAGGAELGRAGGLQRAHPGLPHQPGGHAPLQRPGAQAPGQGRGWALVTVGISMFFF